MFNWFPTFRKAGDFFRNNITRPGRSLLFLGFFCSLGLIYLESPLLYLFTSIFSVLALASLTSFIYRPITRLQVIVPDLVQARKRVKADLYLSNLRHRSAFEVFVEIKPAAEVVLIDNSESQRLINVIRPEKTVRESLAFQYEKRGVYPFPKVVVGSTFPFNLFRFRQSKPVNQKVIVTPAYTPIQQFQLPGTQIENDYENDKQILHANAGNVAEYIGNREYQEGMPVRRWDYSSWARTGKPVVREYRDQKRGMATIFIDSFFNDEGPGSAEGFESLLSLATAIVDSISKKQIPVSRLIIGPTIYSVIEPNPDEQLRTIGRKLALAEISPESESELLRDDLFAEQAVGTDSYGFLLFNKMDENRSHFRRLFENQGVACVTRILNGKTEEFGPLGLTPESIAKGEVIIK